jgi:alkaline phosphatase D
MVWVLSFLGSSAMTSDNEAEERGKQTKGAIAVDSSDTLIPEKSAGLSRRAVLCGLLLPLVPGVAGLQAADSPQIAAPPPADAPLSRIAFGSCHKLDRPMTVWDSIHAQKTQLFIFLGDTVYLDTVDMVAKKAIYDKFAAAPEFVRFRQNVPIVATWDDHDYGINDGGAEYPKRDESQKIFLDFFREPPDSIRWKKPGVYTSYVFGPEGKRTQIILLDLRYFRTPLVADEITGGYGQQHDPNATMMGEVQWKWFEEQLHIPAELRLIVSSIQVMHEEQPNEKWFNMPAQRDKLFKTIADSKAKGVVFISGDVHHGEIAAMDIGAGYTVYEITSSGLNCVNVPYIQPNKHQVTDMQWTDNFGMIQVDWTAADPNVSLELRTGRGNLGSRKEVKLSELRPGR